MREIDDRELVREMVAFFGAKAALSLLGWCTLTGMRIPDDEPNVGREVLIRYGFGSQSARYANVARLMRFKEHLTAKGLTLRDEADEQPARVVRRLSAA